MKFKNTLIAATLLLSITSAQAALVESDWKNAGDTLATLDTDTGIEWLDLTQTLGMSINEASGDVFEDWRFPTKSEVSQMMDNAFPSFYGYNDRYVTSASADRDANHFRDMFGTTRSYSAHDTTRGIFKNDPGGSYSVLKTVMDDTRDTDYVQLGSGYNFSNDYDFSRSSAGVYLVSDGGTTLSSIENPELNSNNASAPVNTAVPEPSSLALLGLTLMGFASVKRKKSNV